MNKELQETINTLLLKSYDQFQKGADFLVQEIPQVIQQLLIWHTIESIFYNIIGVILLFILLSVDYKFFHIAKRERESEALILGWGVLGTFARIAYIIPITCLNLTFLKIYFTPKLYLLEYASKLLK